LFHKRWKQLFQQVFMNYGHLHEVANVVSKVAVVQLQEDVQGSLRQALKFIGNTDDLNSIERSVVVKVGVFDHKTEHHATVGVVDAVVKSFNRAPQIFLVESDNYRGTGSERLQIWKSLLNERVVPFNLSDDTDTKEVKIADERIHLSHILFKPNIFVSTHILRKYEKGSVLKNLLGLIPDRKKVRFHKKLEATLLDAYEAIGGIDLAVIDGTYADLGVSPQAKKIEANLLLVGRDAVAVEAVGAFLVGLEPNKIPVIQEAMKRGLGEGNLKNIEVLGNSVEILKEKIVDRKQKKKSSNR